MADFDERKILEFYHIPTLFPSEWPAEKDEEDESENETETKKPDRKAGRSLTLDSTTSERRYLMKTDGKKRGANNLVLKDEPDPLGTTDSVVRAMRLVGLNLQDDARLRDRFMLSSTTFSPALFLSQMHAYADTNVLLEGLDVLSRSIDQKSASLKVLVESNFERFVKAKATIDNVYKEMKHRGEETPSPPKVQPHAHAHGRRASRSSFRGSSGKNSLPNPLGIHTDSRKKNALVKESEYGVLGIKGPLLDVSAKAEDVWGPALGGREKEENLRAFSSYLTQFKEYVELSPMVSDSIKRKDYETLVDAYSRARRIADAARELSTELGTQTPDDAQLYQMLLAGRMWYDVETQLQKFKRQLWRRLVSLHTTAKPDYSTGRGQEQHMEILSLLLELGVDNNPVWVWLLSRYDHLKGKIAATADHTKAEIELLRRRLAGSEKPLPQVVASHLRHLVRQSLDGKTTANDSADVIELWEKILTFLNALISPQGILGEVLEFWQTAQSFIDGDAQKSLPMGYNGESQQYHQLPGQAVADLEKGVVELVELMRGHLYDFFAGLPPEDLSLIFSPVPLTPHSPISPGPGFLTPNSLRDPRLAFEPGNLLPPFPQTGEHWEKLSFWPPWANSISGVHYLSKMLALVGSAASDLATIGPVRSDEGQVVEQLKSLVGISRERCVTALCAAWNRDAENIKYVEDWQPSAEPGNVTRMPASFAAFEGALLAGIQKILYVSEVMAKPGAGDIVLPPPTKLLQMVRNQYITTLYKALSGMVENAERSVRGSGDDWSISQEALPIQTSSDTVLTKSTLDAGNRNVRMLLTLSNLQALRSQVVPGLNSKFENAFSVKLTDESKTIRDVLGQIDARLFQSYTKQSIDKLEAIIQAGIGAPDWAPTGSDRPSAAKPYVYEALLSLVVVHSEVSTTASSLTTQVLSFLFEQTSMQLLEAFRKRPRYSLWALVQATLDVEFIAQTLSQYVTETTSELQSQIYQELDSRTEGIARGRLQNELPGMRDVLKKLRDASKNQFACFKKVKRPTQVLNRTDSA